MKRRAIFLDRDGTLNVDAGFTHRVEDLRLLDGVIAGLRRLQSLGFELLITTNQSGVARGYFDEVAMHAFNAELVARLRDAGITIAGVYCCPFHPTEGIGVYRCDSPLRKPKPGMILRAAVQHDIALGASFAIGDKPSDVAAGRAAGCRTILLRKKNVQPAEPPLAARPDFLANDVLAAAQLVEQLVGHTTDISPALDCAYFTSAAKDEKPARTRA